MQTVTISMEEYENLKKQNEVLTARCKAMESLLNRYSTDMDFLIDKIQALAKGQKEEAEKYLFEDGPVMGLYIPETK